MGELNFLLFDLMHDKNNISKLSEDYIADVFTRARMFTQYGYGYYTYRALQNKEELLELVEFLKNDAWIKVYGKSFGEFQK